MSNILVRKCGMVALWVTSLSVAALAQDNPVVSKLFSDHMVLQRGMPVPVWGTCKAGTKVTVKFGTQEKSAEADKDGKWMVRLDALTASTAPAELTITSATGNAPVKVVDVLVGEVYLCGGQSNMAFYMKELRANDEIAKADFPLLRQNRLGDGWAVCSPATNGDFCATSYYFGRKLVQETGIPIGILNAALSGTPIEKWLEAEGFKSEPVLREMELNYMTEYRKNLASHIANTDAWLKESRDAMTTGKDFPVKPKLTEIPNPDFGGLYGYAERLVHYAFRSLLWYQGESNGDDETKIYLPKLRALITGWRKVWQQGDFPFYIVQLPSYSGSAKPEGGDGWSGVRLAQLQCHRSIKNTGLVVLVDLGEADSLHPTNKVDVGNRLALWALANDFGKNNLACSGPIFKSSKIEGGKVRIEFDSAGKGLMVGSKKGQEPVQEVPGGKLKQFAIAAADPASPGGLKWVWAEAVIDGNSVVVSSPEVPNPVAVHYADSRNPEGCNLYNKDGLPASPFRTNE